MGWQLIALNVIKLQDMLGTVILATIPAQQVPILTTITQIVQIVLHIALIVQGTLHTAKPVNCQDHISLIY